MLTIEVNPKVKVNLNDILAGISKLEVQDLETFFSQVGTMLAHRRTHHLSEREFELLSEINQGLPTEHRLKYLQLKDKLHAENISEAEHKELLVMSEEIEQMGVRRLERLVELSKLRGVGLQDLMKQLGIKVPLAYG